MSPYENRINSEDFRRVALIAEVSPENVAALTTALENKPQDLEYPVNLNGVRHLHIYLKPLGARTLLFVYFEMDEIDQELAVSVLKNNQPWWSEIEPLLTAHVRSTAETTPWQRAEFINVIADKTDRERSIGQPIGLAAGLHTDKELWYRTLHQTNWPGVIDQMNRSHYQNWTTFMLEFEEELVLFTHVEYMGEDKAADDALMQADPVTNRWWTHTQPCLYPLVKDGEPWIQMDEF